MGLGPHGPINKLPIVSVQQKKKKTLVYRLMVYRIYIKSRKMKSTKPKIKNYVKRIHYRNLSLYINI